MRTHAAQAPARSCLRGLRLARTLRMERDIWRSGLLGMSGLDASSCRDLVWKITILFGECSQRASQKSWTHSATRAQKWPEDWM